MWAWAAMALLPTTAGAAGDSFCGELGRIVAAAREHPPFASLGPDGRHDLMTFAEGCGPILGDREPRYVCMRQFAPPELSAGSLRGDVARCLPGLVPAPGGPHEGESRYRAGDVVIGIAEGGSRYGHVGREVILVVYARR